MDIFTSYFSRAKGLDVTRYFVVSIARFQPKDFFAYPCLALAPSAELLLQYKNGLSRGVYEECYRHDVLESQDIHKVFEGLAKLANGRDIVLCCYERPFQFCHRRLLARYVEEHWHYFIEELI